MFMYQIQNLSRKMKSPFFIYVLLTVVFFSCSDHRQDNPLPKTKIKTLPKTKPSSAFSDTLKINTVAAVFYIPDSFQLQKIKLLTDSGAYESIMHEYEYLSRTAHSIIKKDFLDIPVIEAKNVRYLLFLNSDKTESCIDLDKNYDPYGLYIFNGVKAPQLVDMANTETDLGFYFSK